MIEFIKIEKSLPYKRFLLEYQRAYDLGQKYIEAINVCSYNSKKKEVTSRFVNLKYIKDNKFYFFTNYNSPKSQDFQTNNNIACTIFWSKTNVQIRIKAQVEKISSQESDDHFYSRSNEKNILAISSMQSSTINSYEEVIKNYENTSSNLKDITRPSYWGGYAFQPYYFEFWEGNKNRINKRESFSLEQNEWLKEFLQP